MTSFNLDAVQRAVADRLDRLARDVAAYVRTPKGFLKRLIGRRSEPPQGIYMFGGVGRGKSMLMDRFFQSIPITRKRRVHFHGFMLEVHDFLHKTRTDRNEAERVDGDLIALANKIAAETSLLCFDEFHVTDVADAMILGRLFTALFERGVVVVATSNFAPDGLYKDGLQRDRFVPFIELLKEKLEVIEFTNAVDYRLNRIRELGVYFWPDDKDARARLDDIFSSLTDGAAGERIELSVKSREIVIPRAARKVACFTFDELCVEPKSALDYIEIAKNFTTVIIAGVPKLNDSKRNETRRFITLIDTLYEMRRRVIISAAAPAQELYKDAENADLFTRTASRLMEMQSRGYLAQDSVIS